MSSWWFVWLTGIFHYRLFNAIIACKSAKSGSEEAKELLNNIIGFLWLKKRVIFRLQIEPCDHTPVCCSKPWPAQSWLLCWLSFPAPVRPAASVSAWSSTAAASVFSRFGLCSFWIFFPPLPLPVSAPVIFINEIPWNLSLKEEGLRQIFVLTMEVLQEFTRRENLNAQMSSVFQRYLALANHVLSWNFLPPNYILLFVDGRHFYILYLFNTWDRFVKTRFEQSKEYFVHHFVMGYKNYSACPFMSVLQIIWETT